MTDREAADDRCQDARFGCDGEGAIGKPGTTIDPGIGTLGVMSIVPRSRLLPSKLEPISLDDSTLVRERVVDLFAPLRAVTLVSAMPGSGKSVAVRQWLDRLDRPVGWVNVDSLDVVPEVFWTHVLAAIMLASSDVDEEPMVLLHDRTAEDPMFLVALAERLIRSDPTPVLVLDGRVHRLPESVVDGLVGLVERVRESLHLVVVTQADPAFPIGRWRSEGLVHEVRGSELCFTDDEAVEFARHRAVDLTDVDEASVRSLNRTVDGWPIALRLALESPAGEPSGAAHDREWPADDRWTSAQLGAQVLAMFDEADLEVALGLSVLDELDPAICLELVGDDARATVKSLLRHDQLLTVVDHRTGTMRFHPLVRRLLELELAWRDPVRRLELHRRAAAAFEARGDVRSAFRHLDAVGETDRARSLVVDAAVSHVDRGDLPTLHQLVAQLPNAAEVERTGLAIDLGLVAAWGDGTEAARRWWTRASELASQMSNEARRSSGIDVRLRQLECMSSLLDADLEAAIELVEAMPRPAPSANATDMHMAFVAARALIAARHPEARDWVDRIESFDGPPIVTHVTIPALRAWQTWVEGDLDEATRLSESIIGWLEEHQIDVHHWAIDSLITAGWCRLSRGDLAGADEIAQRAELVATFIPCTWNRAQASYLTGTLALARGDAEAAFRIATETRAIVPGTTAGYAGRLVYLAAESAACLRRQDAAIELAAELPDGPGRALLRARWHPMSDAQLEASFAGRAAWSTMHRLRAEAILATRSPGSVPTDDLVALVSDAARTGWVQPFLNLGPRSERTLRALPLADLHPALLAVLDAVAPTMSDDVDPAPRLTNREMSLLELLPTHLSYAEMAERMYLSVNTVKASLKGLYRKLDAHTRAEAVAAGQRHGLI